MSTATVLLAHVVTRSSLLTTEEEAFVVPDDIPLVTCSADAIYPWLWIAGNGGKKHFNEKLALERRQECVYPS